MRLSILAASVGAAAAGSWQMLAQQFAQNAFGLGMFNDGKTGVLAASNNCFQTLDGGNTFNPTASCGSLGIFPLGSAAAYDTADGAAHVAAMSGESVIQFSWNSGANFSTALGSQYAGGSNIQLIFSEAGGKPGGFAIYGPTQDGNSNGVVVSYDGGFTWTALDASAALGNNTAANGWNPSASTWFLLGNQQPNSGGGSTSTGTGGSTTTGTGGSTTGTGGSTTTAARTSTRANARMWHRAAGAPVKAPWSAAGDGFAGSVYKSTNAGKEDWAPVFSLDAMGIAPLAIACQDEAHCAMVGYDGAFSYVFTTSDGATFASAFNLTTPGAQLLDIRPTGPSSYIAGGTVAITDAAGNPAYTPILIESADGGATWTNSTLSPTFLQNVAITGIFCLPATPSACWLTAIDPSGAAYIASNYATPSA